MISLFMVPSLMHVRIASLEFLIDALRLTLFLTLKNVILWSIRVQCQGIWSLVEVLRSIRPRSMLFLFFLTPLLCRKYALFLDMLVSIGDSSKIALPLSKLLQKDVDFVLHQHCKEAFEELKRRLPPLPSCNHWIGSFHSSSYVMPPIMHLGLFCHQELIDYHMSLLKPHALWIQPKSTTPPPKKSFWLLFLHQINSNLICFEVPVEEA